MHDYLVPPADISGKDPETEPWRTEHAWHHTHQAQLDARGIDRVNSPMTREEAAQRPEEASQRHRLIRSWTVFFLGIFSLIFKRKRLAGFFHRRPGFRWRIRIPAPRRRAFVSPSSATSPCCSA